MLYRANISHLAIENYKQIGTGTFWEAALWAWA